MQLTNEKVITKKTKHRATPEDIRIAKLIQFYRTMRGVTYRELAEHLDVSIQQLQKYESGTNRISAGTLQRIITKLRIPLDKIF
jgi:transcriptional regulator with XRE-family HTH domain